MVDGPGGQLQTHAITLEEIMDIVHSNFPEVFLISPSLQHPHMVDFVTQEWDTGAPGTPWVGRTPRPDSQLWLRVCPQEALARPANTLPPIPTPELPQIPVGRAHPDRVRILIRQSQALGHSLFQTRESCSRLPLSLLSLVGRNDPSELLGAGDHPLEELHKAAQTPQFRGVRSTPSPSTGPDVLTMAVENLLRKRAVSLVPLDQERDGFYSTYFLVSNRDKGLRPILNLKYFNLSVLKTLFKMETLKSTVATMC